MQQQLHNIVDYCKVNDMKINIQKTKTVLFNTSPKYDFMPRLSVENATVLEVVEQFKLLGVIMRSDLSWKSNTEAICKKG